MMSCKKSQAMLFYNQDYNNHDYKKGVGACL